MTGSQDRKVWIGGGVIVALLIAAASWFMLISPELDNASSLRDQAASTQFGNAQLQSNVAVLKKKSEQMSRYSANLRDALETLPFDSGLPAFTRQVYAQAQATHVKIDGITVGGITAATTTTPGATSTDPAAAGAAPTTAPTTTPTDPAATAATVPIATGPVAGAVQAIQLQLVTDGTLKNQRRFLSLVQYAGPRRTLISGVQLTPGSGSKIASIDGGARMTSQLTVFSAPQTPDEIARLKRLLAGDTSG
jgi:hypothetical protein